MEHNLTSLKVIVSRSPKEYLEQGKVHCGVFAVKGILSAYDKDHRDDPRDYHLTWWGKITGGILPKTSEIYIH